ncbi:MAG: hypothetical protein OXI60_10890 [Acidiferrobacterales bacterium]|nr:hypothetical protein [Acidiferrobacterales bacterium]
MNLPSNAEKVYVDEQSLILDGYRLGRQIFDSGFRPDFIAGIWRGGSAVGIVVQECLQYFGIQSDHIAIRTSYQGMQHYNEMVRDSAGIQVHGLEYLVDRLECNHRLLLVDDVFSSGLSIQAVREKLNRKLRRNMPADTRVCSVWYRPVADRPSPDYFVNKTDCWLVLPYEFSGLGLDEIRNNKGWAAPILESIRAIQPDRTDDLDIDSRGLSL